MTCYVMSSPRVTQEEEEHGQDDGGNGPHQIVGHSFARAK